MTWRRQPARGGLPERAIYARALADDRTIAWCEGYWDGDKELVREAERLCKAGEIVRLDDETTYVADAHNPAAVVAVIVTVCGRRAVVGGAIPEELYPVEVVA